MIDTKRLLIPDRITGGLRMTQLNYLLLYAMTHSTFLLSLLCVGGGMCMSRFVLCAELDILPVMLEVILGPIDFLFFFFSSLTLTLFVIFFTLYIRDTPEASTNLITTCVDVFWDLPRSASYVPCVY